MSCLHETLMSLSGRYRYGEVRPVFVAELIPSKDFLGTEVKMFPMLDMHESPTCWERLAFCSEGTDSSEDPEMAASEEEKVPIFDETYKTTSYLSFEDIKDDITYIVKLSTVVNGSIIKSKLLEVEDVE